ncbi:MAG: hypothetical protein HY762_01355 [Planctomycetes bacterium]|nr:hypothetical protein [Planctomycetota bacterium]
MVVTKRFLLITILALGFLVFLYQVGWSEPTPPPDGTALTDKKFVHWYLITVPTATGTEKVGHLKVISEESTSSPAGIAAPKERIYKIYREAELTSPTTLPYVTMNDDSSFVFDASKGVFKITKISIRFVTADNKEINIKSSYANNKLVIATSGSGVKAPVEWKEATESDTVSLLSESIMGVYLAIGGWKTQSHSCRLISPYCAKPFFESLVTVQGKEVIKGKEGESPKEAYQCHLVVTDPDAFVKESDYLFEPNGFILKQTVGNVTIARSTYEEVFGSNKTFERKGRDDPFRLKMTRRVEKGTPKGPDKIKEVLSPEETDRLIKEAEDNLTQMKKISDTLPDGLEKSEAMMKPYQNILRIETIIMTQSDSPGRKKYISRPNILKTRPRNYLTPGGLPKRLSPSRTISPNFWIIHWSKARTKCQRYKY